MSKRLLAVLSSAVLIIVIILLVTLLPSKDICSDDVRGYENTASSSLDAIRENLSKVKATVTVNESQRVPAQLDGLTATNFAALKACDIQCKLLGRCLRFVFMKPPSEACPVEYVDYKARTEAALKLLQELHGVQLASKQAAQKAEVLDRTKQDVKELEKSSGSTGGRVAVLKAQAEQLENDLSQALSVIGQQLDGLIPEQTGSAAR